MAVVTLPEAGIKAGFMPGASGWSTDMNTNLRVLDALLNPRVVDKDLNAPPGAPTAGQVYIIGPLPTGVWAARASRLAVYISGDDVAPGWLYITPKKSWQVYVIDEDLFYRYDGSAWIAQASGGTVVKNMVGVACSDESTALTLGTKTTFHMQHDATLESVFAGLTTGQASGSTFTVDIRKNGGSIFTTPITIDNNELTSITAAAPYVSAGVSTFVRGDKIEIAITQIGATGAMGLKVYFNWIMPS